ncbi:MAG: S41 family peptidase [Hyphomonadaceae bacterium]
MRLFFTSLATLATGVAYAETPQELAQQADSYFERGDCPSAIPLYRQAFEENPADFVSASLLTRCLVNVGTDDQAALASAQRAAEFPSERANRLLDQAVLYTRLGDHDHALTALDQAVRASGATFRMAGDNLERNEALAPLRSDPRYEAILAYAYGPGYEPAAERGFSPDKVRRGVELILNTVTTRSPNAYRYFTPAQWRARADQIIARAPELDEASYFFELVSLIGMNGDIHTSIFPSATSSFLNTTLPVRFFRFSDGLYIRAANPEHRNLVGARVVRIGTFDVEEGWDELTRRFPGENPTMASAALCFYLLHPEFAHAQGWTSTATTVPLTLRLANGRTLRTSVRADQVGRYFSSSESAQWLNQQEGFVDAAPWGNARTPLWMTNRDRNYWYQLLPDRSAIYFAFNLPRDDENVVYDDFVLEVVHAMRTSGAHRLVIDLRNNPGGWGFMAGALTHAILGDPELNQPGRIVVLTSRATQSAGTIIAAALERDTNAVFVGEPTGDAPNLFNAPVGNHVTWAVPGAPVVFRFSSLMEQESVSTDTRNAIYPDAPVWMSFADYAAGRDPVLERALSMTDEEAQAFLRDPGGRALPWYAHWQRPSQAPAFPNGELPRRYY